YIPEGHQTITPTRALRRLNGQGNSDKDSKAENPAAIAGSAYEALVWELPRGLDLDRPETETGEWRYPPTHKFERLLRECRVPVGLLENGEQMRLLYAPHGEASGWFTFDVSAMTEVGGRPILDAFTMLLHGSRVYGEPSLRHVLEESRRRQANV